MMATVASDVVTELKGRLVDGLAVLTAEGVMDGAGHLSVRIPGTDTFLINPRYPGALADAEDICTVGLDNKRIGGPGPIPSETHIHSAIYRHRPDALSVVHCHPRYAILVGLLDSGLVPIHRPAGPFADGVPTFPDSHGIDSRALGERVARTLGAHRAIFLRGHGVVVTGPGIEGTCIATIQLERACADQMLLMSFTTPRPLERAAPTVERLDNPYRAWPYFLYKHGIRSREEIKASLHPPAEGSG